MPYAAGDRLPPERAGRLGHLEVLKSELVKKLCTSFADTAYDPANNGEAWSPIEVDNKRLALVFGVDGSLQALQADLPPYKALAFVKTAMLRLDQHALSKIDNENPHPFALRDLLADSAIYHATVFPLRNVSIAGISTYDAIRQIIYESLCDDSLNRELIETLKWIVFEKWDGVEKSVPLFECPHCERTVATLSFDTEEGTCPLCGGHILLTDMLGFHQVMTTDGAPDSIASDYMNINETLMLFTGVRYFWENNKQMLPNCLFIKDGPLSIRAQYSKLVAPIRRLLDISKQNGYQIHIIGQEKTGHFVDHLQLISKEAPDNSLFIPSSDYIKRHIQHRPNNGAPYGKDTNYGAKVFVKLNDYHKMVLNIPTGLFIEAPDFNNLIGAKRIFATLDKILSNRFEGALLPIELAHGIASLSTYPSAQILKIFALS